MTKSHNLKNFKSQYFSKLLRYGPDILHVIINLIGFKKTLNNMVSHGSISFISRGLAKMTRPAFSWKSETSPLVGLISRVPTTFILLDIQLSQNIFSLHDLTNFLLHTHSHTPRAPQLYVGQSILTNKLCYSLYNSVHLILYYFIGCVQVT